MKHLRPTGSLCNRIFAPHGWWARFATNVLNRPEWAGTGHVNMPQPRRMAPFVYSGFKISESEKALDKLAQEISDKKRDGGG